MRLKVKNVIKPTIDILLAVARTGGVENCINMLGSFLVKKGCRIRVVQMVYEGDAWTDSDLEFYYAFTDRNGQTLQSFIDGYTGFINDKGEPNLTIAACWPMMCEVARAASQCLGKDFMIASWLHAPIWKYESAGYGGTRYLDKADFHFAISDAIAREIKKDHLGDVIYRVNNPVDEKKIIKRRSCAPGTLLFVGRLSAEKNIQLVLRAISKTADEWKLRIIGDGEERETLKDYACQLGLKDRVEFAGWMDNPWENCDGCYALVFSSMYEGAPLSAIEAMSCGMPVIANVSSGLGDVINPGITGYLYPDNDDDNLAKILDMIYAKKFPEIDPANCIKAVENYSQEIALFDFYTKIFAACNGRIISESVLGQGREIISEKTAVIVPCYNVESFVRRCLDSLLSQSIGISRLQILAVNDGSSDDTLGVLQQYEEKYPDTIGIINLEKNEGQGYARNVALEYVDADFISFVDADDLIDEYMIETLYLAQKCYPADVVDCEFAMFDKSIPQRDDQALMQGTVDIIEDDSDFKRLFMENAFINSPCTRLFRTELILADESLRFPEHMYMEDMYFFYMILARARSWYHLEYKGYFYYQNPNSTMHSERLKQYYMDVHRVFALVLEEYKKNGLYDKHKEELGFIYYKKVFEQLMEYMQNNISPYPNDNSEILKIYMDSHFSPIEENRYYNNK